MEALEAEPAQCTLVGDSVTDIQAAHLASVHSIGYANQPGMRERFAAVGVGATIDSLAELALRLRARVDPALLQLFSTVSRARLRHASAGPLARTQAGTGCHRLGEA